MVKPQSCLPRVPNALGGGGASVRGREAVVAGCESIAHAAAPTAVLGQVACCGLCTSMPFPLGRVARRVNVTVVGLIPLRRLHINVVGDGECLRALCCHRGHLEGAVVLFEVGEHLGQDAVGFGARGSLLQ